MVSEPLFWITVFAGLPSGCAARRTRRRGAPAASEPDEPQPGRERWNSSHVGTPQPVRSSSTRCRTPSTAPTRSRTWLDRKRNVASYAARISASVPLSREGSSMRPVDVDHLARAARERLLRLVARRPRSPGSGRGSGPGRSPSAPCRPMSKPFSRMKASVRGSIARGSRPALAKMNFGCPSELRDRLGHLAAAGVVLADEQHAEGLGARVLRVLARAHVERLHAHVARLVGDALEAPADRDERLGASRAGSSGSRSASTTSALSLREQGVDRRLRQDHAARERRVLAHEGLDRVVQHRDREVRPSRRAARAAEPAASGGSHRLRIWRATLSA